MARSVPDRLKSLATCILFLGCAAAVPAQRGMQLTDSLKAVLTELRGTLAMADSTGDLQAAYAARVRLVPLVRKAEAMELLKQAALIADSLARPDLGAMVHSVLAKRYASAGDHASAYQEALRSNALERLFGTRQVDSLNARHEMDLARLTAASDSAAQAGMDRERRIAEALVEVQDRAERWMYIALATVGLCLLVVVGLLYRMGSAGRKLRASIEALRKEVATLKSAGNRPKEKAGTPEIARNSSGGKPAEVLQAPVHEAMDPVVEAMFHKSAPERLATLRQARERGDQEKVVRVVHSLRPQLASFDEARFAPLCARLMAQGAAGNSAQWSADLDALDAGVSELLQAH